jgi:predicted dehydrogenase
MNWRVTPSANPAYGSREFDVINAAIVGLGWWGKTLVESAEGSDAIRFVAGATRTVTPEVEAFAKKYCLRLLPDYGAVLGDPKIDAVVLATPHSMHGAQVVAAAAAGKHIFCEKPFTLTKREAEEAVAAAQKAKVTLAVGYNRRIHPEMITLRDMIRSGELGTVLHVEATMTFPNALFINPSHWRADKSETPLGGLMPMGVHAVDGIIDLCGPIDHVFAQSFRRAAPIDADDTTSILFRMKGGMSGYLGTMTTTGPGFSFQVFGSKGWLRLEGVTHVAGASSEERRTKLFGACKFQPVKGEARTWQAATLDISRAALEAFAKAAEGKTAPPIPYDQLIAGVAATEAIVRAAASGKVEHVG